MEFPFQTVFSVFAFCLHTHKPYTVQSVFCFVCIFTGKYVKYTMFYDTVKPNHTPTIVAHYGKTRNRIHMPLHELLFGLCPYFHNLVELQTFAGRVCEPDQQDCPASILTYYSDYKYTQSKPSYTHSVVLELYI